MKRLLLASVLMLSSAAAWANPYQINTGGSPAQAQVYGDGSAASAARSTSHATGGSSFATGGTATAKGGAGGSAHVTNIVNGGTGDPAGGGYVGYDGHLPVSSAIAPNVTSFNSCAGSPVSGALQTGIFGLSFGSGNKFDEVCRLNQSRRPDAAIEYLCLVDPDVRKAMKATVTPCAADRSVVVFAAVPAALAPGNEKYRFDYCYTVSAGERSQHKECRANR